MALLFLASVLSPSRAADSGTVGLPFIHKGSALFQQGGAACLATKHSSAYPFSHPMKACCCLQTQTQSAAYPSMHSVPAVIKQG